MSIMDNTVEKTNLITKSTVSIKVDSVSIQKILVLLDGT